MNDQAMKMGVKQAGLSLVELMVSVLIALIILGGAIQVVISSKRSFLDQEESAYIQQNARFAVDMIMTDMKSAGYYGCGGEKAFKSVIYKTHAAVSAGGSTTYVPGAANGFVGLDPITGFDGESGYNNFPAAYKDDVWAGSNNEKPDSFIVRRGLGLNPATVLSNTPTSRQMVAQFDSAYADELSNGDTEIMADAPVVVVAANCSAMGLFKASSVAPSGGANEFTVTYNVGDNCDGALKPDINAICDQACDCGSANKAAPYQPGSMIMPFSSAAYYIAESTIVPGTPALMRSVFEGGTGLPDAEEVATGVENFQVEYAITNGAGQTRYYTAKEISDNSLSWTDVNAVKVNLVFRSQFEMLPVAQSKTLLAKTYNDKYLRQLVSTTLQIRNRI